MRGLPTCARVYFGMFLAALMFDVLAVGVAVVSRQDPRVVYETDEWKPEEQP